MASAAVILDMDPDSAASRAYYAAFHGVTAVLAYRGLSFTKHTAVRAALHRDLIQAGLLAVDLGRDYDYLLDLRETADYGGVAEASRASAAKAIAKASAILVALEPLVPDRDQNNAK